MKKIANDEFVFEDFALTVVTFDRTFSSAQHATVLQCKNFAVYNILSSPQFSSDIKKYLLHNLLLEVIQRMSLVTSRNKILFIQPSYKNLMLDDWKKSDIQEFITKCFTKLKKQLPFPIYLSKHSIDLSTPKTGEVLDLLHNLTKQVELHLLQSPTTRKLRAFTQKNGLLFLDKYCQSEEYKKLLY